MISPVKVWRRQKKTRELLGKEATIISWTIIAVPPADFKIFAPYPVLLVELTNGRRVFGQLVDYSEKDLKVGERVIAVLRKVREPKEEDVIAYGVKFKLL